MPAVGPTSELNDMFPSGGEVCVAGQLARSDLEPQEREGEQHEAGGGERDGGGVAAVLQARAHLLSASEP